MRRLRERWRSGQRLDFILDRCRGRRVLHLGCADAPFTRQRLGEGTLLHALIDEVAAVQYGVDLDREGVDMLREAGFANVAVANVEALAEKSPFGENEFDVIVAGEIIEHLSNPGLFLDSVGALMSGNSTKLVLTTINAMGAYRVLFEILTGRENVHVEHVAYYSRSTLQKLLAVHGFRVDAFSYYPIGREHERGVKRGKGWLLWAADRLAFHLAPSLGDGVMACCSLAPVEHEAT